MEDKKNQRPDPQQQNRDAQNDKAAGSHKDGNTAKAHDQAEEDISNDAESSAHSPNDDLDESETARLGDDDNSLV